MRKKTRNRRSALVFKEWIEAFPISIWFIFLSPREKKSNLIHLKSCCRVLHTKGPLIRNALLGISLCAVSRVSGIKIEWMGSPVLALYGLRVGLWLMKSAVCSMETPSLFSLGNVLIFFSLSLSLLLRCPSSLLPVSVAHLVIELVLCKPELLSHRIISPSASLHTKLNGTWQSKMFCACVSLSLSLHVLSVDISPVPSAAYHFSFFFSPFSHPFLSLSTGFQNGWAKMPPPSPPQSESQILTSPHRPRSKASVMAEL